MHMRVIAICCAFVCYTALVSAHTQPVIFFHGGNPNELDPQQWLITPEAGPILQRVVDEYKHYGDRYVLIIGYDENASTPALSYERSKRRAEATRDALIQLGLPADALATKPCSFSNPYGKATGADPVNRRVEFAGTRTLQELLEMDRSFCAEIRRPETPVAR